MILISFLIPTRKRLSKLIYCLECINSQKNVEEIEVILRLDLDDKESQNILQYSYNFKLKIIIGTRGQGYKELYKYYNECAFISSGKYLLMWNDDANFKTKNWFDKFNSRILKDQTESPNNEYSYWFAGTPTTEYFSDGSKRYRDWPCFIALNRKSFKKLGFYSMHTLSDTFLYHILEPIDLFRKIDNIYIDHVAAINMKNEDKDNISQDSSNNYKHNFDFNFIEICKNNLKQ